MHLWQVEYLISHVLPLLTAIKLSDLHMYEGRTAAEAGIVFGHENMGIVDEVGSGVAVRQITSDHHSL